MNRKKPSDLIRRGLCRGKLACDKHGNRCAATSARAVAWCPIGACVACGIQVYGKHPDPRIDALHERVGGSFTDWVDFDLPSPSAIIAVLEEFEL